MKSYALIFVIILFLSCEQERNCNDFKTGKFKFEYKIDDVTKITYFVRNDSIEIETFEGKTDTATIRWVNDCEYVLTKLHPKNRIEKKAVLIKILATSKNTYTFEFGILGESQKQRGTAIKLN
jgi:hypothetical protein